MVACDVRITNKILDKCYDHGVKDPKYLKSVYGS